jgi:predicted Fe-Mo cluster-binding NifX family protein
VKIENNAIQSVERHKIDTSNHFEKVKIIVSLKPDAVICNGVTAFYENEFHKNNIEVIPWVHGEFEDVVEKFINGKYSKTEV